MKYAFKAWGHQNILATHKTTLEFTKDREVSFRGDCIVGIKADFELSKLKEFAKSGSKIKITIKSANLTEVIFAEVNPDFDDDKELVIRKTDFNSKRTFAIKSDKAAFDLDRNFVGHLKKENDKIYISLEKLKTC